MDKFAYMFDSFRDRVSELTSQDFNFDIYRRLQVRRYLVTWKDTRNVRDQLMCRRFFLGKSVVV